MCNKVKLHTKVIDNTVKIAVVLNRLPISTEEKIEIERYLNEIEGAIHSFCCSKSEKAELAEKLGLKKIAAFDYVIGRDFQQCAC